jgi:hypothetical protein
MRKPAYALAPVLCLAWILYISGSAPRMRSQSGVKPEPAAQFRIVVGLTDSAAKSWQREVTVKARSAT